MPDHVENRIFIKYGEFTEEQISKIKKEFCKEDRATLDLNKFIPQPDNLISISLGMNTEVEYSAFFKYNPLNYDSTMMKKVLNCDTIPSYKNEEPPIIVDGLRIDLWISKWYNKNEHVLSKEEILPNWYAWNTENWGTKWNSYDGSVEPSGIYFMTANSTICPELKKIIVEKLKDILESKQWESLIHSCTYEYNDYLVYCDEIGRRYMNDEWYY